MRALRNRRTASSKRDLNRDFRLAECCEETQFIHRALAGTSAGHRDVRMRNPNDSFYAIRALACLCEKGCSSRLIREIAECSGVPAPYLAKLVRKLAEAGIVLSKRGYKGGVQLARLPEEITLLELARAIDGPQDFDRCLLGLEACSDARACPAHAFWKKTREDIRNTLRRTTLAEVIEFEGRRGDARRTKSAGGVTELSSRFSSQSRLPVDLP
jgi:Rrf2 family transcriptional regulator, iron-sulfur cluster assembly transcription factor